MLAPVCPQVPRARETLRMMRCPGYPNPLLVMQLHGAGIAWFSKSSDIMAVARRWLRGIRRKFLYCHGSNALYRWVGKRLLNVAPGRAEGFPAWLGGHTSRTVVVLRLHVAVSRHTVATLCPILLSSAPTRTGELSDGARESGHTGLGNFAPGRKNIHVTPGQHVTLAPILH
jgi:hypothetical protein